MVSQSPLSVLRNRAAALTDRAHVPFSGTPTAAVFLLSDGAWIPGVRVESASFSLTLPALLNGYTTAVALACDESISAIVLSRPARPEERLYVEALSPKPFSSFADDAWIRRDDSADALPAPNEPKSPTIEPAGHTEEDLLRTCRRLADRAHVPASDFPVAVLAACADETFIPGVNVEHPDWARILCAERNALGTAQSYALPPIQRLFLSCPKDPTGTPCGACRQWLTELAPESELWMDRHDASPERSSPSDLLPGSFRGRELPSAS